MYTDAGPIRLFSARFGRRSVKNLKIKKFIEVNFTKKHNNSDSTTTQQHNKDNNKEKEEKETVTREKETVTMLLFLQIYIEFVLFETCSIIVVEQVSNKTNSIYI